MKYRPDIDGLRAIAVLSVLLFHVGAPFTSGGYVGVDVFFVISGYVITARILEDLENGHFSILEFYRRRIRRILPALLVTLCASVPVFYLLLLPEDLADFFRSLIASLGSISNIYFWKSASYFDPAASTRPFLHTWSLSVEEQFYLFVPIFIGVAYRFSRQFAIIGLALVAAASLAMSIYLAQRAPSANFFLLPTRAWELLMGAMVAMLGTRLLVTTGLIEGVRWIGLTLIVASVWAYDADTSFPGLAAIPPTLGAALIIAADSRGSGAVTRFLAARPMIGIGKISYSLYLVHWPIIVAAKYWLLSDPGPIGSTAILILSVGLAALSWKYVENPIRYSSSRLLTGRAIFAGAASAVALVGVIAYGGAVKSSASAQLASRETIAAAAGASVGWEPACFLMNRPHTDWKAEDCVRTRGRTKTALLWGDSFAAHYAAGIHRVAGLAKFNVLQYTSAGCPPIFGYQSFALRYCADFNDNVFNIIAKNNVSVVVLSARWDLLRGRGLDNLRSTVATLVERGLEVYVIGASPIFVLKPDYVLMRRGNGDKTADARWAVEPGLFERNAKIKAMVGQAAVFIDPLASMCAARECLYSRQGQLLFTDYGHLSTFGSEVAVKSYFPFFHD